MEKESINVKIAIVGDVQVNRQKPEEAFKFVQNIFDDSDFRFCQLESTISDQGGVRPDVQNPAHRVPPKMVKAFSNAKINAVTMAGNNNLDYGPETLFDTVKILKENGVEGIGVGKDIDEARRPHYFKVKDKTIAIVNACSILREGFAATKNRPGISPLHISTFYKSLENIYEQPATPSSTFTIPDLDDLNAVCELITEAKSKADYVIACFHWGVHFTYDLAMYQPDVAYAAIDAGADVIIGTHPHNLQAIDTYKNKPIFYSMGNFIFDQPETHVTKSLKKYLQFYGLSSNSGAVAYPHPRHTRDTMIVCLNLSENGSIVKIIPAHIAEDATPRIVNRNTPDGNRIFKLINDLSAEIGTNLEETPDGFLLPLEGKEVDTRVLLRRRKMSYPWLYRLRVAEEKNIRKFSKKL